MRLEFNRRRAGAALGLLLALAACKPAPKPPPPPGPAPNFAAPLSPSAQAMLGELYAETEAGGMVIAVVRSDQMTTDGFGQVSRTDHRRPDGRTLVRLQSVSKLLASDTLAALVAEGRVRLTDPLARYAPAGWTPPSEAAGDPITLVSLATHTSGLPRGQPYDPAIPAGVDIQSQWDMAAKLRGLSPAGRGAHYSNLGFDLLGEALADASKTSYPAALAAEITGPLSMQDTTATPNPDQCARLMAADARRAGHPCVDQTGEAASGGIYSTADDMALWLRSQLSPDKPNGRRQISQQIYVRRDALAYATGLDHAGRASGIGLAWIELDADETHPRLLEKTGGGDGFLSYVVIDPARRVGVFVDFNNVSGHRLEAVADMADTLVVELGAETPAP